MKIVKYEFGIHSDGRGNLIAIENPKDIPFEIKRIYYIYGTGTDITRGKHAHKDLKQILICVHGSCKIRLDNGKEKEIVLLDKPNEGLYIDNDIWREMFDFSSDAVLLVLASRVYDENDYIRDYEKFIKYVSEGENK